MNKKVLVSALVLASVMAHAATGKDVRVEKGQTTANGKAVERDSQVNASAAKGQNTNAAQALAEFNSKVEKAIEILKNSKNKQEVSIVSKDVLEAMRKGAE